MNDEYNPLDHLPDPAKRCKVLAYTRGPMISVEILMMRPSTHPHSSAGSGIPSCQRAQV